MVLHDGITVNSIHTRSKPSAEGPLQCRTAKNASTMMISVRRFLLVIVGLVPLIVLTKWLVASTSTTLTAVVDDIKLAQEQGLKPLEGMPLSLAPTVITKKANDDESLKAATPSVDDTKSSPAFLRAKHERQLQQIFSKNEQRLQLDHQQNYVEDEDCVAFGDTYDIELTNAIQQGNLVDARNYVLQMQNRYPGCEKQLSAQYTELFDGYFIDRYSLEQGLPWGPSLPYRSSQEDKTLVSPPKDEINCWNPAHDDSSLDLEDASTIVMDQWDSCCSQIAKKKKIPLTKTAVGCYTTNPLTMQRSRLCCAMYQGSLSHLRLPALQELSLTARFNMYTTDVPDAVKP